MRFYLGVTDNKWYKYLAKINPEDINFWQPSGTVSFRALEHGAPFLFKLKSPLNVIAGVGFFSSHSFLPLTIAWDAFKNRNGCSTFDEFSNMILNYRTDRLNINPTIGCIILTDPIFFKEEDWIETPKDWSNNIVQGKGYNSTFGEGERIWDKVDNLIRFYRTSQEINSEIWTAQEQDSNYGFGNTFYKYRIGQGAFRILVTDAYEKRCAITGEKTLPVLEAAHIKSFSENGPNKISNGLLLRSDLHKLFDCGYLTITKNHTIEVSSRIKLEFQNGKEYYQFHGQNLKVLPSKHSNLPDKQFIDWHNTNIFKS